MKRESPDPGDLGVSQAFLQMLDVEKHTKRSETESRAFLLEADHTPGGRRCLSQAGTRPWSIRETQSRHSNVC